jgi:hypothetical protein
MPMTKYVYSNFVTVSVKEDRRTDILNSFVFHINSSEDFGFAGLSITVYAVRISTLNNSSLRLDRLSKNPCRMFVSEEFLYTIDIRLFYSDLIIFGRNFQLIINTVSVILSE